MPISALSPPTSLTATASSGKVVLNWVLPTGSLASLVTRSAHGQNNFLQIALITNGTTTTFSDYGVTNGLTYDYQVYDLD